MTSTDIQLGFAEKANCLNSPIDIAKVGGKPLWLDPEHIPSSDDLKCGVCGRNLILLLQIYTAEDYPAHAYHRAVYIFVCSNGSCHKIDYKKCTKALRSQLPLQNHYYESNSETELIAPKLSSLRAHSVCEICKCKGTKLCGNCRSSFYCSKEHQLLHWNVGLHKSICKLRKSTPSTTLGSPKEILSPPSPPPSPPTRNITPPTSVVADNEEDIQGQLSRLQNADFALLVKKGIIFPEWEIVCEPEVLISEDEISSAKRSLVKPVPDSKLQQYADESYEETETGVDKMFLKFQKRIEKQPEQILRYCRTSYHEDSESPLFVSSNSIPQPSEIPPCPRCAQPRTFEFQILSSILHYLNIDNLKEDSYDFGTYFVYTCPDNCTVTEEGKNGRWYVEEVILRQDFSTDGMNPSSVRKGETNKVAH